MQRPNIFRLSWPVTAGYLERSMPNHSLYLDPSKRVREVKTGVSPIFSTAAAMPAITSPPPSRPIPEVMSNYDAHETK